MMSVSLQLRDSGFKLDSSSAQDTTKASCGSWQIIQTWSAWENLPGLQTEKQHVTSAGWRYAKDGGYGSYTRGRIFSKKTTMDNSVEWAGNSPSASDKPMITRSSCRPDGTGKCSCTLVLRNFCAEQIPGGSSAPNLTKPRGIGAPMNPNQGSISGKNDSPVMLEVLILMLASRLILLRPLMGH
ncbi:uncharacterized protein LOC143434297 isoform X1 [Arvicanthis niloticus]|uniref:uncharacterized protein LOC143308651 isoform X1 n=1 Tax=Arvicanthis niloticus TaxID=61156 RepID=UPI00402BED66